MAHPRDYDWIDDAFDETKQDPLAEKGMTGCSSMAVLVAALAVAAVVVLSIAAASSVGILALGWTKP